MIQLIKNCRFGILAVALILFCSCNKDPEALPGIPPPSVSTGPTLAALLDAPELSILKAAAKKAGLLPLLSAPNLKFTVFAPDNAAFIGSGIPNADSIETQFDTATVIKIVSYLIIPQQLNSANIPETFPNYKSPTILNPAPTVSPLIRLTNYISRRGSKAWVNNIPVTAVDVAAANGVLHKIALLAAPPSLPLMARIATDPDLTLLNRTIQRADSGRSTVADTSIVFALSNLGPSLTVLAPVNSAFKRLIEFLSGGLIPPGSPDSDYINFIGAFPVQEARGLIAYHVLTNGAFSVNIPSTPTNIPTYLNSFVPIHPGLTVSAIFDPSGYQVIDATVKGFANPGPAKIFINPLPNGSSDQHFINGVLHKIDMVLLPK